MRRRTWTDEQLQQAVKQAISIRHVLKILGLKLAGGNYSQVKKYLRELGLSTEHFKGRGWNKGLRTGSRPRIPLEKVLVAGSVYQSFKLKSRLFAVGLKEEKCEECAWNMRSTDGRLPLELDHINGDSSDNRLENLRVLCPNCHSLKPTHRGKNRKKKSPFLPG